MRNKHLILTLILAISTLPIKDAKAWTFGGLPRGSFDQSCYNCFMENSMRVRGHILTCHCRYGNNIQGRVTSINLAECGLENDIQNCNGTLECIGQNAQCISKISQ